MTKFNFFLIGIMFLAFGCGQSSKITPSVEARTTAEVYGDGKYIIRSIVVPISDQLIDSYDSPMAKINYVAGGFSKLFMNLAASIGMGRTQLSLFQPVPEIPQDYIKGLSIKRIFFYIEPKEGERHRTVWQRYVTGRSDVDFTFLDKLAVKIKPHKVENVKTWAPHFESRSLSNNEFSPLQTIFDNSEYNEFNLGPDKLEELVIVKYDQENSKKYLRSSENGTIFIMNSNHPIKAKRFLEENPKLKNYFKKIHILLGKKKRFHIEGQSVPGTLLVELVNDPVIEESFKVALSESAKKIEEVGIELVEVCTKHTCLDVKVPDTNILPLITKGNAIKLDTFMDTQSVPDSFQLKGFIEFEIKIELSF